MTAQLEAVAKQIREVVATQNTARSPVQFGSDEILSTVSVDNCPLNVRDRPTLGTLTGSLKKSAIDRRALRHRLRSLPGPAQSPREISLLRSVWNALSIPAK